MRCFEHPEKDAVGLCRVCEKGLCKDCAVEYDSFLFCKEHAKDMILSGATREDLIQKSIPSRVSPRPDIPAAPKPQTVVASKPTPQISPALTPKIAKPQQKVAPTTVSVDFNGVVSPAIFGAIISGTPSGIPFLNLACIIWAILGGAAAAYFFLLKESSRLGKPARIVTKDAIRVGAASGLVGASIAFAFSVFAGVNFWQPLLDAILSTGLDSSTATTVLGIMTADQNLAIIPLAIKWLALTIIFPIFGAVGAIALIRIKH